MNAEQLGALPSNRVEWRKNWSSESLSSWPGVISLRLRSVTWTLHDALYSRGMVNGHDVALLSVLQKTTLRKVKHVICNWGDKLVWVVVTARMRGDHLSWEAFTRWRTFAAVIGLKSMRHAHLHSAVFAGVSCCLCKLRIAMRNRATRFVSHSLVIGRITGPRPTMPLKCLMYVVVSSQVNRLLT